MRTFEPYLPPADTTPDIVVDERDADDEKPASAVFDNRRRGEPLLSCDCMTCFGYCLLNHEILERELRNGEQRAKSITD